MRNKTKKVLWLIIIIGIVLRITYIIKTPITQRQHDVYGIENQGHLGYIYKIFESGKLPTTNDIQFYHPPLHHYLAAGWLRLETLIGIQLGDALEGIQILTALYSSLILIVVYKILNKTNLKDLYKILIMAIIAVHPTFIILAGSINNDILTILLIFTIVLYLLKWDEDCNIKNTILLALATGLCVMSKVSGAIMAIPILFIFIKKIIEVYKNNKKDLMKLFGLFVVFGIISLPIGLWHPIRNKILFNQPIGGVLIPSQSLYVGNYSWIQRFISISFNELKATFCTIPGDHNIPAFIIKTSVLGEFSYANIGYLADIIKSLNIILILISIIAMIWNLKLYKNSKDKTLDWILGITYIVHMASYIYFNIEYPYLCTMDFRYIVPTLFVGLYCIGRFLEHLNNTKKYATLTEIIEYLLVIFCVLSIIMIVMI